VKSSSAPTTPSVAAILAPYRTPSLRRSLGQLLASAAPFALVWIAALLALRLGYWATLILAVLAAGFLLRLFMIQHDCGHGAFFRSHMANDALGTVIGLLTLMPYAYWRRTHAIHHKTSGDLDYRGIGDIETLTVREYWSRSTLRRLAYRAYRHPLVMLGIGPGYQFILKHRLPLDIPRTWIREWRSVLLGNLAILAVLLLARRTVGLTAFLGVQLPISLIAGSIGVFLFYVQHQFEDTYWREHPEWEFQAAGLQGSSYLVLPKVLQWFTANIGLHHIHHINSRIPNYRLQQSFDENPILQHVTHLTLRQAVGCLRLSLWDEDQQRLVSFRQAKRRRREGADAVGGITPGI
jgi:acyl-lipid omega-6 desaturase (Delta-12 desaturase)